MIRRTFALLLAASGALALRPEPAEAQVRLDVHLFWRSGDDGVWRPHRYAPRPRGGAYVLPLPVRAGPAPAVRIPRGHLPPPGACRLWYPGRPPGHQPPPMACGRLFRSGPFPGAIILGSPGYRGHDRDGDAWKRDRGGRGSGPPRGSRGRGNRGGQ